MKQLGSSQFNTLLTTEGKLFNNLHIDVHPFEVEMFNNAVDVSLTSARFILGLDALFCPLIDH